MTFQFMCPSGDVLEGEEALVGQECQCPLCGSTFVVPSPHGAQEVSVGPNVQSPAPPSFGPPQSFQQAEEDDIPGFGAFAGPQPDGQSQQAPAVDVGGGQVGVQEKEPEAEAPTLDPRDDPDRIVHILCPNGHELETPMSMVDTDAMCPHCSTQFRLRYEDSTEYKEERERLRQYREEAFGRSALKWAIVAAVLVVLGLIGMIILGSLR